MIGFIIWLVGVICCIWCIKDVWSKGHVDTLIKIVLQYVFFVSAGSDLLSIIS